MKKFGILVFIAAIAIGLVVTGFFKHESKSDTAVSVFGLHINKSIEGNGKTLTQERSVSDFTGINVGGAFHVIVSHADNYHISVKADENLLPLIKTEVSDGVLTIYSDENLHSSKGLVISISMPNVSDISVSGAAEFAANDIDNWELSVESSGAANVSLAGKTKNLTVEVSGDGSVDAGKLVGNLVVVEASGAGSAKVFATEEVNIEASGASSVLYGGTAQNIQESSHGAGSITKF